MPPDPPLVTEDAAPYEITSLGRTVVFDARVHVAAHDLTGCSSLSAPAFDVGTGAGVVTHADHGDAVQGVIRLAVTAAVEQVTDDLA